MNKGDEDALDHIVTNATLNHEPWELVVSQVHRCARIRRSLNSGKPTIAQVDDFLASRRDFYEQRMLANRLSHEGGAWK